MAQVKYTKGLADEMESYGVALRASGAYVHRSFDSEELERLKVIARQPPEFEKDPMVVIAVGRGCLARWAKVSRDKRFASFLGKIVSLKLLNAEVYTKQEFAAHVKNCPITKLRISSTGEVRIGLLYGSIEKPYASLIDVVNHTIRFTDIEIQERSNNRHIVVKILDLAPEDIQIGKRIQDELARIAGSSC